jgi:hypothetical protein
MSLNTVNVVAIDEERLKFRVTVALIGHNARGGTYKFLLAPPTSFANSAHYNSCTISCGGFQAACNGLVADPCWTDGVTLHKSQSIELMLSIPSSQTSTITSLLPALDNVGQARIGGYRELIMLEVKSVGDGAGNVALAGRTAVWNGLSQSGPILCGNPFGQSITITNMDPFQDTPVYLTSAAAGGGGGDAGGYLYSFDITMVPNQ